ncbi:unnamed protein product [Cunninghamella echinulata]
MSKLVSFKCTSVKNTPTLLFTINYIFVCRNCNPNKSETFERTTAGWKDICVTTIANLALEEIEYRLERARTTTWWATLGSCLYSSKDTFVAKDERQRSASSEFVLSDPNLWHIRPVLSGTKSYSTTSRPREKRKSDDINACHSESTSTMVPPSSTSLLHKQLQQSFNINSNNNNNNNNNSHSQSHIEKWVASNTPSPRSSSPQVTPSITPAMFSSSNNTDHPFNRFGFKYIPCEKTLLLPHIAYRQTENTEGSGCMLSVPDKSSYVSVANDGLTITTDKGFRMCRTNVGVREGNWYWEATILKGNDDSGGHVRIGWARREACLNAPVGYDAYSYGYRDKTGEKVFCSRLENYGEPFETGDVIGLYISLPPRYKRNDTTSSSTNNKDGMKFKSPTRKRIPILFKDTLWFEEKDYRQSKEMEALADRYRKDDEKLYEPKKLEGSYITIYKNGVSLGVMYTDLTDYEDFGSLPEMILAQHQKKKRKYNSKKDNNNNNNNNSSTSTPTSSSTTATSAINLLDDEDFDGNSRHQQWNDDPPLVDDGTLGYYPAVSVYKGGVVTCNFGPDFQYPPTDAAPWKPMCERYKEYMVEECMWDLVDEVTRCFRKKIIE